MRYVSEVQHVANTVGSVFGLWEGVPGLEVHGIAIFRQLCTVVFLFRHGFLLLSL